jgi:hypothetical protein
MQVRSMGEVTADEFYKLESNLALTQQILETLRGSGLTPNSDAHNGQFSEAMRINETSCDPSHDDNYSPEETNIIVLKSDANPKNHAQWMLGESEKFTVTFRDEDRQGKASPGRKNLAHPPPEEPSLNQVNIIEEQQFDAGPLRGASEDLTEMYQQNLNNLKEIDKEMQ